METEIMNTIKDIDEGEWNTLAGTDFVEKSYRWYKTVEESGMTKLPVFPDDDYAGEVRFKTHVERTGKALRVVTLDTDSLPSTRDLAAVLAYFGDDEEHFPDPENWVF